MGYQQAYIQTSREVDEILGILTEYGLAEDLHLGVLGVCEVLEDLSGEEGEHWEYSFKKGEQVAVIDGDRGFVVQVRHFLIQDYNIFDAQIHQIDNIAFSQPEGYAVLDKYFAFTPLQEVL